MQSTEFKGTGGGGYSYLSSTAGLLLKFNQISKNGWNKPKRGIPWTALDKRVGGPLPHPFLISLDSIKYATAKSMETKSV
jgi:hypothetical protein